MKPKRMVTFHTETQRPESKLHQLCESMGKLRVEKSIHKFPLFSILKSSSNRTQLDQITDSLATCDIAQHSKPKRYHYTNPMTRLRDLPVTANAYYDRNYSKSLNNAKNSIEDVSNASKKPITTPYVSVGQIIQIYPK
jgi:hypothetical protein